MILLRVLVSWLVLVRSPLFCSRPCLSVEATAVRRDWTGTRSLHCARDNKNRLDQLFFIKDTWVGYCRFLNTPPVCFVQ